MAEVIVSKKACAENPLKSSAPLGAALAYLGIEGSVPLFHGSQGCTSFALVLAVRHFKEAIPLQTTAMNEASTVLGGADHLEEAIVNIVQRMKPKFIGIASTALVETRGEDFVGELHLIRKRKAELLTMPVVFASTPDFEGALEEGWAKATTAVIESLAQPGGEASLRPRINILPGVHQTPGDIEVLRELCEAFALDVTFLPDVSGSLDGHVPDAYVGTSLGGTRIDDIARLGNACHTIAIGDHMRAPAEALRARAQVPYTLFPTLTGLRASDALVALLSSLSGRTAPAAVRRQRSQLVDAMLDGHFWFSGRRLAMAADPDLLLALSTFFTALGATVAVAVTTTKGAGSLAQVPADQVLVGDLADFERLAKDALVDLLVTHSHGRMASDRLGVPLYRVGFPIFDRLGHALRSSIGYRGSRDLIFEVANLMMAVHHEAKPEDFSEAVPSPAPSEVFHVHA
ncbi:MAG: Nitrogenase iron-molybdenum cofactor biosynthesis protein nifN [Pseudomonadota bacterium]|jgi:nitrogenase molybdenum-iron protein NifN